MVYLINRNPSGRIICLHALLKYLYNKFSEEPFTLTDMKYDSDSEYNIHQTCTLLVKYPSVPFPVCPYLQNPLSKAKCYLTQSVQKDTQKSKSVSDAFNSLEGLGFVMRTEKGGKITEEGKKFATIEYRDDKCFEIIREGLLNYGPFIGLLDEFSESSGEIDRSDIKLGYPVTQETVRHNGNLVRLSTGSRQDTITRTRSVLFIWSITGGFSVPVDFSENEDSDNWHVRMLPYIKSKRWTKHKFKVLIRNNFFEKELRVDNPLHYDAMTKTTRALRERNQEAVRNLSLQYEEILKNRRFAIVYLLAKCAENNRKLDFEEAIQELKKYQELFVINNNEFRQIMYVELGIAPVSGIPFRSENGMLTPLTKLNFEKLCKGTPEKLIEVLDEIYERVKEND